MNAPFAAALLGWKEKRNGSGLVPNTADSDNAASVALSAAILDELGVSRGVASGVANPQSGRPLELAVASTLKRDLPMRDSARNWIVNELSRPITDFLQYDHLKKVDQLVRENAELRTTLGTDYIIKPDVVVGLPARYPDEPPFLHAAISCKWTIRSDRVQNIRHENNQMIRHRRERLPHLVTVTAEPLPSRLAAIARGTGEVDAVYHIAFDALDDAVVKLALCNQISVDQVDAWNEVTSQGRVRPYSDLAETLALW
ncbi:restriction endonuclease [Mycobacterium sp. CBMA271]|uniref:NgoMIV family type II restriction endonuclease n=1 Tax=unclassified Mycobacteroides TaxID=2618759 RepID=UPI00132B00BF|nr:MULTISPECIES: NgoMIV family type II restriction endonuclease [unclassified Mycobacteroides]MUM19658.1 restriction endonuclease [Mycobacteroides sp. CBMA 326]MUM24260.1 restriction endonuclease [Mycobacteroides sp. CBMA 271]